MKAKGLVQNLFITTTKKKHRCSGVRESIDTESRAFGLKSKPHFQNRPYSKP